MYILVLSYTRKVSTVLVLNNNKLLNFSISIWTIYFSYGLKGSENYYYYNN